MIIFSITCFSWKENCFIITIWCDTDCHSLSYSLMAVKKIFPISDVSCIISVILDNDKVLLAMKFYQLKKKVISLIYVVIMTVIRFPYAWRRWDIYVLGMRIVDHSVISYFVSVIHLQHDDFTSNKSSWAEKKI